MSIDIDSPRPTAEDYETYRALSTSAIASLVVGSLSSLAIFDWALLAIPVMGAALSTFALMNIKRHPQELTGTRLATAGLALSLVFLVAAPLRLTYAYMTEFPPGYGHASYSDLQPDENQAGQQVPPSALALEGKRIGIKGYIYPGREKDGIRQFLLCRDQGDCCFGGNPKITDRIQVTLVDPLRLTYQPRLHKVGGTFHVEPAQQAAGGARGGVLYHLTADYLD